MHGPHVQKFVNLSGSILFYYTRHLFYAILDSFYWTIIKGKSALSC